MNTADLPLFLQYLLFNPSFPVHSGSATIECIGDPDSPFSRFVENLRNHLGSDSPQLTNTTLPALVFSTVSGHCLVAVRGERALFSRNFGTNLCVQGEFNGRPFSFHAPQFYCRRPPGWDKGDDWVLFEPLNEPAILRYRTTSQPSEVSVLQLNFSVLRDSERTDPPLTVSAAGREVTFLPAPRCRDLIRMLEVDAFDAAPTTEIRFSVWPGSTDQDLTQFAWDVTGFCGFVAQQQTNPVMLSACGSDGQLQRVEFYRPVRSSYREGYLLPGLRFPRGGLADFFATSFEEFVRLKTNPSWQRLFNMAWAYDDGVYLETRVGSLLAAVELLIRTTLVESGKRTQAECDELTLPKLIGAARRFLGWNIPRHYTQLERYSRVRNAAAHANGLPYPAREILDLLQKWALFLYRRLFIRLGYKKGQITSATKGFRSFSDVDDFSEDANDFTHRS